MKPTKHVESDWQLKSAMQSKLLDLKVRQSMKTLSQSNNYNTGQNAINTGQIIQKNLKLLQENQTSYDLSKFKIKVQLNETWD